MIHEDGSLRSDGGDAVEPQRNKGVGTEHSGLRVTPQLFFIFILLILILRSTNNGGMRVKGVPTMRSIREAGRTWNWFAMGIQLL